MQIVVAMVAVAIVVVAVAGRMITSFAIHPKHINEYGYDASLHSCIAARNSDMREPHCGI